MNREQIIPSRTEVLSMAREAGFVVDEKAQQHQPNCIFHTHHMVNELLERFAALVSKQERGLGFNQGYKQAIKDCVVLLMIQHEMANGAHNYWHVAANLIQAEYGVQHDD